MQVQVLHTLAGIRPGVGHNPVPVDIEAQLRGHGGGELHQPAQQLLAFSTAGVAHGGNMTGRDNQDMLGRLRVGIPEGHRLIGTLDDRCRNRARDDPAEDAVHYRLLPRSIAMWAAAAIAAVSNRRTLGPRATGVHPALMAASRSSSVKPPSGPTRTVTSPAGVSGALPSPSASQRAPERARTMNAA